MPEILNIPLVGRESELASLGAALSSAATGRGSVHLIAGAGGIGKTRLAAAVTERAIAQGFRAVLGRANPVETGIPYALFADAFLPLLRDLQPSALQVLARGATAELEVLFPALRKHDGVARGSSASELKPRLLDSFTQLLHHLAAREPLLVTLENLQWADPSSLELLHFVARSAHAQRLLIVCTYADEHLDANPILRTTEQSLRSLNVLTTHRLAALTRDETADLVGRTFAVPFDAIGEFVSLLHDRTRGNPFFVEETLKALVASGRLRDESGRWVGWSTDDALELPPTIRSVIAARLDRLGSNARRLAAIAAVAGIQSPHALLEAVAGLTSAELLAAIDELRRERILAETGAGRELAYEFTHPLLHEVLYADLGRARARALHGEIADALERLFGERSLSRAEELAAHFLRADSPERAPRACRYLTAAGRSALERGASREASEALTVALAIAERLDDAEACETLVDLLARARQRLGDYESAATLWERAVSLAGARGEPRRVAVYQRRLGVAAFWSGRYDAALRHYDLGLAAARGAHDETTAARIRLAGGAALLAVGRATEAEKEVRLALEIAERVGEPRLLSRVHQALQALATWRGPSDAARDHGERALAYAVAAKDRAAEWTVRYGMALHAGLTGDATSTAAQLAAANALAEELRSPLLRLWGAEIGIEYRSGIGEWDGALALADRTIADAHAFGQRTLLPRLLVWSALVHTGRGDFERANTEIEEAWALSGAGHTGEADIVNVHTVVPAHVGRAAWHLARLEYAEAIAVGEAGLAIADRTGYSAWAIHRLMPILAEASLWIRDWRRAEHYAHRLRASAELLGHRLGLAWADGCFAIIHMLRGDDAGAVPLLRNAALALESIPFVDYAARVRCQLAIALRDSGDRESAIAELRAVHEVYARLGAQPSLDYVRDLLRSLGARPPARTAATGTGALTARETEIAQLVAQRKSNKEIGAALRISSRTVGTHLANVFTKLGVDSRGTLTDLVRAGTLDRPSPVKRPASAHRP